MKTKQYRAAISILIFLISIFSGTGCKKLVEAELPIDKLTGENVFGNTGSASAALSNIYYLFNRVAGGTVSPTVMNGFTADEFVFHNGNDRFLESLFTNTLASTDFLLSDYWKTWYDLIFRINSVVEKVAVSNGIPVTYKNQLIGQAKFLRAFAYFYLVNLYGGVPIVTSTDYKINTLLNRSSEAEVYGQILNDLIDAQSLVNENYLKPDLLTVTSERVTANKIVVSAFLARIYLYTGQWEKAEVEASKVITNANYSILRSLDEVFLANSAEAIWQIEGNIAIGANTLDGGFFIPENLDIIPKVYLTESLVKAFEDGDLRLRDWTRSVNIGSSHYYYPFKYKQRVPSVTTEYNMMLRLSEQYLIRAEARAKLNNLNGAIEDLNVLRSRAKVSIFTSFDQQALLRAIEKERQVELFSEWGHRWFDLKRTGRADILLGTLKGSDWQPTDKLFPIPSGEFSRNPNLKGHQNEGYTEQ